ncbi:MAG: trimethylamine methyltransferase family protein [Stappia sp.]
MSDPMLQEEDRPRRRATRSEGGGARDRRRARRASGGHAAPAYITRQIPPYDILDEERLLRIEAAADRILAEIGVEIRGDDAALALFRAAGAGGTGLTCTFEPGMLREILKTAPAVFTQHARNPARSVEIGGPHMAFAPAYGSPFVMDLDRGRRYGTLEDFQNFVKLACAAPWLHHSGGTVCEPTDVPVNKRHLDMVYAHMRFSDKPFLGSVTAPERAEDSVEMARILFGAERVERDCVIMGNVNVNSPLVWDGAMTGAIRAYAAANQGSVIVPFILGGAMGPVTTAGAIAQALAETMVGCALTQLVRPGAPVIFGNFLSSMALRSGSPTFGTPEPAAGSLVVGQLARRLNLPLRCAGAFTTSKLPDAQALQESTMSMLSAVQSGANFLLHSAGFLDGLLSMSYEKFVLDVDQCGALHSYLAGVAVDDNSLALDAFAEVGPGNHFFGCAHTMTNYETCFWDSQLADNDPFETWDEGGRIDAATRANARWKAMLADYEAPALDEALDEALTDYIARKKASMDDAWY